VIAHGAVRRQERADFPGSPGSPIATSEFDWSGYLSAHPQTAQAMLDIFGPGAIASVDDGFGGRSWEVPSGSPLARYDPVVVDRVLNAGSGDYGAGEVLRILQNPGAVSAANLGQGALRDYLAPLGLLPASDPRAPSAHDQALAKFGYTPQAWDERSIARTLKDEELADLKRQYGAIYQLWSQYFGSFPSNEQVLSIAHSGGDASQWEQTIRAMPSHIPGINAGAYSDAKAIADKVSQGIYGHQASDDIIKDLIDKGDANPSGAQYYYDQLPLQPGKNIAPTVYNLLYKSAEQHTQAVWNQVPSPIDLHTVWQKEGSPGAITPTQSQQVVNPQQQSTQPQAA
jgi:hypothetical protein